MNYVLASASPRRKELLKGIIKDFSVYPSDCDEQLDTNVEPEEAVEKLATAKCRAVAKYFPEAVVIGCDTIVCYKDRIYGKPKDREDARATLLELSGKVHDVITGVCVRLKDKELTGHDVTEVQLAKFSDDFLKTYLDSLSPMDKAGSYGIQDMGVVTKYWGSYTNVVGLPVSLVKKMIEEVQTI